ncbi:MAG: hypothetical protein RLZZ245_2765 [Verrucomicrobiota bacterium]|jgi:hypothetical protein
MWNLKAMSEQLKFAESAKLGFAIKANLIGLSYAL